MAAEQDLVARAKTGDQDAFARLVEANQNRIYALTLRMTGNPEDGADLAQEAFLRAWKGLAQFQEESSFSTWLYKLASNACLDFLRREKRRRTVGTVIYLDDDQDGGAFEVPDYRPTPEEAAEHSQMQRALHHGLNRLSQEHRQVLVLRELEGLSYAEIGTILNLEEGTVKSRIARARLALRKILLEEGNFFSSQASDKMNSAGRE